MHRVMVVDDDEPNLKLYVAIVERVLGGEALAFLSPLEALAAIETTNPSLFLVDFNMPELDGIEFIERLRSTAGFERVPVMLVTAESERYLQERALAAGANIFLSKPFATLELIRHIRQLGLWTERHTHGVVGGSSERERDVILRLHRAMDARDPRTACHMRASRDVAVELGHELGISKRDLEYLRWGALVYDIGKFAVPENVLTMPSCLTPDSRALVNEHAEAGAIILSGSESGLLQAAESMARYHHERFAGEGYPEGLRGEKIPLLARIMCVADTFVALTSHRPHRHEMTFDEASEHLQNESGEQFDPNIVAAFIRIKDRLAQMQRTA